MQLWGKALLWLYPGLGVLGTSRASRPLISIMQTLAMSPSVRDVMGCLVPLEVSIWCSKHRVTPVLTGWEPKPRSPPRKVSAWWRRAARWATTLLWKRAMP